MQNRGRSGMASVSSKTDNWNDVNEAASDEHFDSIQLKSEGAINERCQVGVDNM